MGKYNVKFEKFKELKFFNPDKLYIFENGIFYIAYNEDADKMKEIFGFLVKQMGNLYRKCEFPVKYFERYEKALKLKNIEYEIVDMCVKSKLKAKARMNPNIKLNESRCNNLIHLEVLQMIQKADLSSITPIQAMNLLAEMQSRIKDIKSE